VANALKFLRQGAVGFIDWLDAFIRTHRSTESGKIIVPSLSNPYSIGCVRPRPLKMDHIAFHRSSAVRVETVNDLISVFGRVVESR